MYTNKMRFMKGLHRIKISTGFAQKKGIFPDPLSLLLLCFPYWTIETWPM